MDATAAKRHSSGGGAHIAPRGLHSHRLVKDIQSGSLLGAPPPGVGDQPQPRNVQVGGVEFTKGRGTPGRTRSPGRWKTTTTTTMHARPSCGSREPVRLFFWVTGQVGLAGFLVAFGHKRSDARASLEWMQTIQTSQTIFSTQTKNFVVRLSSPWLQPIWKGSAQPTTPQLRQFKEQMVDVPSKWAQ